jgi:hypothetical protein
MNGLGVFEKRMLKGILELRGMKSRPLLREGSHVNKPTTDRNKHPVASPKLVLEAKTDWPTDRRS